MKWSRNPIVPHHLLLQLPTEKWAKTGKRIWRKPSTWKPLLQSDSTIFFNDQVSITYRNTLYQHQMNSRYWWQNKSMKRKFLAHTNIHLEQYWINLNSNLHSFTNSNKRAEIHSSQDKTMTWDNSGTSARLQLTWTLTLPTFLKTNHLQNNRMGHFIQRNLKKHNKTSI